MDFHIVKMYKDRVSTKMSKIILSRNERRRFGALKSDSTHHFFRNACTKSGSWWFSQFSGCWSLYIFTIWKSIVYNRFCRDGIYFDKILVSEYKLLERSNKANLFYSPGPVSWKLKRPQIQLRPHNFLTYTSNLTAVVNSVLKFMINGTTSILKS
jgi:hypothetical protein